MIGMKTQNKQLKEKYSYFYDTNAIMIISGCKDNLGVITYANDMISELISVPIN